MQAKQRQLIVMFPLLVHTFRVRIQYTDTDTGTSAIIFYIVKYDKLLKAMTVELTAGAASNSTTHQK